MIRRRMTAAMTVLVMALALVPFLGTISSAEVGSYLIMMSDQPDPAAIGSIPDLIDRRRALYQLSIETAARSQGPILTFLKKEQPAGRVRAIRCLYIVNACSFKGERSVADALASRPDVLGVFTEDVVRTDLKFIDADNAQQPLWHLDKIRARQAWATTQRSGQGIVVGLIGSGADVGHAALRNKYRGYDSSGLTNDRNWFDANSHKLYPVEEVRGYGTHGLGSAVGGDGPTATLGSNTDVGIAYRAKWVAAKAFDADGSGSTTSVLLAMQSMQFPVADDGTIRPEEAPDIVVNPWWTEGRSVDTLGRSPGCTNWFKIALKMWREAGMLPVFAAGDGAIRAPADLPEALAVGSTDTSDAKASFSPTGTVCGGSQRKPDLYAPGIGIYSSFPGTVGYAKKRGTGTSAPLVAGAAALVLESAGGSGSLSPSNLQEILRRGAASCTGDSPCKRVDVLGALQAVDSGTIRGSVRASGIGIAGSKVTLVGPQISRTTTTDAQGGFSLPGLPQGTYTLTASAPARITMTQSLVLAAAQTLDVSVNLAAVARYVTLRGRVTQVNGGEPAAGAKVQIQGTSLSSIVQADGSYEIAGVPDPSAPDAVQPTGYDYSVRVTPNPCLLGWEKRFLVPDGSDPTVDVQVPMKRDAAGYSCQEAPFSWRSGETDTGLRGDDDSKAFDLPFPFRMYEHQVEGPNADPQNTAYTKVFISTNGYLRFDGVGPENHNLPSPDGIAPHAAIYGLWDDINMDVTSRILTSSTEDSFVVEYRDMTLHLPSMVRVSFSITLHRNGDVDLKYLRGFDPSSYVPAAPEASGRNATVGIEDGQSSIGFIYSFDQPALRDGLAIAFSPAGQPTDLIGTVSGSGPSGPSLLGDARIRADIEGLTRTTYTDVSGRYRLRLEAGVRPVRASAFHHYAQTRTANIVYQAAPDCGATINCLDFTLTRVPGFRVSGRITDPISGAALKDVPVSVGDPRLGVVTTDAVGRYVFDDVPADNEDGDPVTYQVTTQGSGRCRNNASSQPFSLAADRTIDLTMASRSDQFGYRCEDFTDVGAEWLELSSPTLTGSRRVGLKEPSTPYPVDTGSYAIEMPFDFPLYDKLITRGTKDAQGRIVGGALNVSIDGHVTFSQSTSSGVNVTQQFGAPSYQPANKAIPNREAPNLAIYPFWDDLIATGDGSQIWTYAGTTPGGVEFLATEWKDFALYSDQATKITMELILYKNGNFDMQYLTGGSGDRSAAGATLGLENLDGTKAFQYSSNESVLHPGSRVRWIHPSNSIPGGGIQTGVTGRVTAATKDGIPLGTPIPNADVIVGNGIVTATASTNALGDYSLFIGPGSYTLYASRSGYSPKQVPVLVPADGFVRQDVVLNRLPQWTLSGKVFDQRGAPHGIPEFQFQVKDAWGNITPIWADGTGAYSKTLDEGTYEVVVWGSGRCQLPSSTSITLDSNLVHNLRVTLPRDPQDPFGYTCIELDMNAINGLPPIPVGAVTPIPVPLPFEVNVYGASYRFAHVYPEKGTIRLGDLDRASGPVLRVFGEDITFDAGALLRVGIADTDTFAIQWTNVGIGNTPERTSFEVVFRKVGFSGYSEILYQYDPAKGNRSRGSRATIGLFACAAMESMDACTGSKVLYSQDPQVPVLRGGLGIKFSRQFA